MYMRVLFTDIAVLQSFLGELSPDFVVCHDWDFLGDREQASKIAVFIAPNSEIASRVEYSLVDTAKVPSVVDGKNAGGEDELPFIGADVFVSRLQKKLDSFEAQYCGQK